MSWTMDGYMNGGTTEFLFFVEPLPLLSAEQPLVWATQLLSSRSWYNLFSNLRLQPCLPAALQHHWYFPAQSFGNAFWQSRLQTCIAGASHQVEKHSRSAAPNASFFFVTESELSLQQASVPQSVSPVNSHASATGTLLNCSHTGTVVDMLTWLRHDDDMMTRLSLDNHLWLD